ncbi:hypothetical protein BS50DRAFT_581204 [Corynespora cassiicola Philippines]|uniref:Uncharacterized protein n=1 Tax=Corynespora cassiicola Philippines TaxID=1448308 RepID=A0A2T2PA04_CORCC|nr:hypothetical protein BS50DRAFT_581204 [Corynespora cassiicola Philippines]
MGLDSRLPVVIVSSGLLVLALVLRAAADCGVVHALLLLLLGCWAAATVRRLQRLRVGRVEVLLAATGDPPWPAWPAWPATVGRGAGGDTGSTPDAAIVAPGPRPKPPKPPGMPPQDNAPLLMHAISPYSLQCNALPSNPHGRQGNRSGNVGWPKAAASVSAPGFQWRGSCTEPDRGPTISASPMRAAARRMAPQAAVQCRQTCSLSDQPCTAMQGPASIKDAACSEQRAASSNKAPPVGASVRRRPQSPPATMPRAFQHGGRAVKVKFSGVPALSQPFPDLNRLAR